MSWLKRINEWLNQGEEGASASSPLVCGVPASVQEAHAAATEGIIPERIMRQLRPNDTERLGYDAVNLPDHYKAFPVEPIRFTQENKFDALQSAIVKYVSRFRLKNGVEDLRKAVRCLDMLIAFEEGDPDWWKLPGERASRRTYII